MPRPTCAILQRPNQFAAADINITSSAAVNVSMPCELSLTRPGRGSISLRPVARWPAIVTAPAGPRSRARRHKRFATREVTVTAPLHVMHAWAAPEMITLARVVILSLTLTPLMIVSLATARGGHGSAVPPSITRHASIVHAGTTELAMAVSAIADVPAAAAAATATATATAALPALIMPTGRVSASSATAAIRSALAPPSFRSLAMDQMLGPVEHLWGASMQCDHPQCHTMLIDVIALHVDFAP